MGGGGGEGRVETNNPSIGVMDIFQNDTFFLFSVIS